MRYQIPQFINIKDKMFGPFTFQQFVYLAGGAGISYVLWEALPTLFAILAIVIVVSFSLALAFYKIHNRPFIEIIQAAVIYGVRSKFYIWKQQQKTSKLNKTIKESEEVTESESGGNEEAFSGSKLNEIAWGLDVLDMGEGNESQSQPDDEKHETELSSRTQSKET